MQIKQYFFNLNTKFNCDKRNKKFGTDRQEELREMATNWKAAKTRFNDALAKQENDPCYVQQCTYDALPKELKVGVTR